MKIKPTRNLLQLQIDTPSETKTSSGIILVGKDDKLAPYSGLVISAGPGKFDKKGNRIPMIVKEGDTVYFPKASGSYVKIDEENSVFLIEEDHIIGIAS